MIDHYFPCDYVQQRLQASGYGSLFDRFAARLHDRGYAPSTIRGGVWAVEHFTTWLNTQKQASREITEDQIRLFWDHVPTCHCRRPAPVGIRQVRPALNHLLQMVRDEGKKPDAESATPIEVELEKFRCHLRSMGGLAESTCIGRVRFTREFLHECFGDGCLNWDTLKPNDVISFVTNYAARLKPGTAQEAASSLRSFLRYLKFYGQCNQKLIDAVPSVRSWRLAAVPKSLTEAQLSAFLGAFDRRAATGCRDYAMALCQAVLGLRVGEVVNLLIDDIDWRSGVMQIRPGKTLKARELPLAKRVGQAIAEYLHKMRPASDCRNIFMRHRAPRGAVSLSVVKGAMRMAFARAKGCEQFKGTHVLRHTAATNLLCQGVSLKEISDVLGHRDIETTSIYAKVDLPGLQTVVAPWPETQV